MITVEVNGQKMEAETEKEARKLLRKALAQEKKEHLQREEYRKLAHLRARSEAYNILERKLKGETFHRGWRFYDINDAWATKYIFKPQHRKTMLNTEDSSWIEFDHYGNVFLGGICNGAGFLRALFLQDDSTKEITCYTIGTEKGIWAIADCPTITIADFPHKE